MADSIDLGAILNGYAKEIRQGLEKVKDDAAKEAVSTLKTTSPKHTGRYAASWKVQKQGSKRIILNNGHGQLTHLLEKGHVLRNGGRTAAQPHIKPVETKVIREVQSKTKEMINRAK